MLLLLSCASEPDRAPAPPPKGGAPSPDAETIPWEPALAARVPPLINPAECPDADGDTFPDAWTCPATPPERADCDDGNPAVTPDTERWVPPGPFLMGSNSRQAGRDEAPVHAVSLSGYCLDRNELSGDNGFPVEGIAWTDAKVACEGKGKVLPTEAQWEKAARGGCELGADPTACDGGDLRAYPWGGDSPDCTRANLTRIDGGPKPCEGKAVMVSAGGNTGPYGHAHLAGNVWEWVSDSYHPAVYRRDPPRVDPTGPASGEIHVLRGGGWNTFPTNMRAANRFTSVLDGSTSGVRCARSKVVGNPDPVEPIAVVTLSGTLTGGNGPLTGKAIFVSAFDPADADPTSGALIPGRSPVAEAKLPASGQPTQDFSLPVPAGGPYIVMAALESETPGEGPAASTGGIGSAGAPVAALGNMSGIAITIQKP